MINDASNWSSEYTISAASCAITVYVYTNEDFKNMNIVACKFVHIWPMCGKYGGDFTRHKGQLLPIDFQWDLGVYLSFVPLNISTANASDPYGFSLFSQKSNWGRINSEVWFGWRRNCHIWIPKLRQPLFGCSYQLSPWRTGIVVKTLV